MLVLHKLWGSTCCPGCRAVTAYVCNVLQRASSYNKSIRNSTNQKQLLFSMFSDLTPRVTWQLCMNDEASDVSLTCVFPEKKLMCTHRVQHGKCSIIKLNITAETTVAIYRVQQHMLFLSKGYSHICHFACVHFYWRQYHICWFQSHSSIYSYYISCKTPCFSVFNTELLTCQWLRKWQFKKQNHIWHKRIAIDGKPLTSFPSSEMCIPN